MINAVITIKNKLEVKSGGVVSVPGCEPTSSLTSMALSRNLHCNASIIPVKDVLKLIPGSRLIKVINPVGQSTTGWFVELPAGPPRAGNQCPPDPPCMEDWYAILRANARVPESEEEEAPGECAGFNYSGCVLDQDVYHMTRDALARPNSNPLGGVFG